MHTSSRTWKSQKVKAKEDAERKHKARVQICPESPFFTEHFNFQQHATMMAKEQELAAGRAAPVVVIPTVPFHGKIFEMSSFVFCDDEFQVQYLKTYCSPVLCLPTIWQQGWITNKMVICPDDFAQNSRMVAPFPTLMELKFEGPDRVSTSEDHLRFFPVPREPRNDTVAWARRPFLKPHALDALRENALPTEEDIEFHKLEVGLPNDEDLQHSTDCAEVEEDPYEGVKARRLVGDDLLAALDPQHVYF